MIATLTGGNHFLLSRRLRELTDEFIKEHGELAVEPIEAEEVEVNSILDAMQASPFLSNKKMVILKDLSVNKQAVENIEQIISSVSGAADVIIYDPSIDKRTAYFKVLKSKTQLEEFGDLDAPALAKWLIDEAKKRGANLSSADVNYLIDRVGADQERLFNELEKLIAYSPDISRANIDLLSVKTPQSRVFDLLDAAFAGNKKRAIELYDEQRAQKVEPQAITAMIAWQLRLLALAKSGFPLSSEQIAKDAGVSPYPIMKAQKLANKLSENQIKKMVKEALEIDEFSKTRTINLDEAVKAYLVSL